MKLTPLTIKELITHPSLRSSYARAQLLDAMTVSLFREHFSAANPAAPEKDLGGEQDARFGQPAGREVIGSD